MQGISENQIHRPRKVATQQTITARGKSRNAINYTFIVSCTSSQTAAHLDLSKNIETIVASSMLLGILIIVILYNPLQNASTISYIIAIAMYACQAIFERGTLQSLLEVEWTRMMQMTINWHITDSYTCSNWLTEVNASTSSLE